MTPLCNHRMELLFSLKHTCIKRLSNGLFTCIYDYFQSMGAIRDASFNIMIIDYKMDLVKKLNCHSRTGFAIKGLLQ